MNLEKDHLSGTAANVLTAIELLKVLPNLIYGSSAKSQEQDKDSHYHLIVPRNPVSKGSDREQKMNINKDDLEKTKINYVATWKKKSS